ncbi:hypothetical protein PR048_020259 [Dryococelus australis]|uniref:Uncharacterized protein n=1 Tax=Dryococelus australis TaxID=614101 RepID=A0ABQ9H609_9NEOP|nr:hypothetical protein PR048_020259 [Dryococelus australis]
MRRRRSGTRRPLASSSTLQSIDQCTRAVFFRISDMAGTECEDVLDVELVIAEAKKHPEIGNDVAEEFYDRTKKRSAWIVICRQFSDDFDEKEDNKKNQS